MQLHFLKLLCLVAICPQIISAQVKGFTAFKEDPRKQQELINQYQLSFAEATANLPRENRKELKELYQLRHDQIRLKIDEKELYTEPSAAAYLQSLTDEIIKANPTIIDQKLRFFFARTGVPNASSLGEGMIVFNMGLFIKLKNESQAAFIVCHEIAHHHLHHGENSMAEYVATLYSAETQEALKSIKRSRYNKAEQLDILTRKMSFDTHRHSRDHESEADSMAIELMRNTGFDLREALSTLSLLDSVDTENFNTAESLKKHFSSNGFQGRWLKKPSGLVAASADHAEAALTDSLKTHPDCNKRIEQLQPLVEKYQSPDRKTFINDPAEFNALQERFNYEIVASAFASHKLTRSLYYALMLLEKSPGDAYLISTVGAIFKDLYQAQKSHLLSRSAELPSPAFSDNYNLLLQFVNNLYLEDFAAIGYHFMKQHESRLHMDKDFQQVYQTLAELNK